MKRLLRSAPFVLGALCGPACSSSFSAADAPEPEEPCSEIPREDPLPRTDATAPRWVFEPWISKDISDRADTYAFVDGFRERGIPVGAVVLDSPWETHYNTFEPSPTRYADFPGLVRDMHERGVRVVLWMTSAVNQQGFDFEPGGDRYVGPAPNLEQGLACKFFIDDGELYTWWKGPGAFVDFFHPRARTWWHRQQDRVLDTGIDGWKLDFAESYIQEERVKTYEGDKTLQEYSERYYEDFLAYGRSRRGSDFVTMVRGWDASYQFPGRFFARPEDAPVAWMGDNRRDWIGLSDALDHMFVSAKAGYRVVGSDVGGYLDIDDEDLLGPKIPFDTLNFARWVAVGALSPFFQLHGRANLAPWTVPDHEAETVALYRYWARLHHAIVPFLYAHEGPLVAPIGEPSEWPGDYRYLLGEQILVAPILDASGKRSVLLPPGSRWFDWWTGEAHDGGTTLAADVSTDRAKIPFYIREGAILPMEIDDVDDVLGLGGPAAQDALTLLVWPAPGGAPPYRFRQDGGQTDTFSATDHGTHADIQLSAVRKPLVLRIRSETAPASVTAAGAAAAFEYDAPKQTVVVRVPAQAAAGPLTVVVTKP